jgi:hypothetical protein
MSVQLDDPRLYGELLRSIALSAMARISATMRDNHERVMHGLMAHVARTIILDYPQVEPNGALLLDAGAMLLNLTNGVAAAYAMDYEVRERMSDYARTLLEEAAKERDT